MTWPDGHNFLYTEPEDIRIGELDISLQCVELLLLVHTKKFSFRVTAPGRYEIPLCDRQLQCSRRAKLLVENTDVTVNRTVNESSIIQFTEIKLKISVSSCLCSSFSHLPAWSSTASTDTSSSATGEMPHSTRRPRQ